MGEVALQVDRNIGRSVAMKTLHDQGNQDGVRRARARDPPRTDV